MRDRDTTGNGTLNERLYVQQDANGNVTALVNTSGVPVERYVTALGVVTVLDGSWNTLGGSQYEMKYLFQGGRFDAVTQNYIFGPAFIGRASKCGQPWTRSA